MSIRVLAVDDEADIRRMIEIKLAKAGFEVLLAADGEEGTLKAIAEKPDVLIVDVMMPKKDGYTLVEDVRAELGRDAPIIIMLTARSEAADVVKGLSGGADDYITKPFSPSELIERINVNLAKKGKTPL